MPLLENNKTIENIEPSAGVTQPKEFVYTDDPTVSVPSGVVYHKIRTKNKRVVYLEKSYCHSHNATEEELSVRQYTLHFLRLPYLFTRVFSYYFETKFPKITNILSKITNTLSYTLKYISLIIRI